MTDARHQTWRDRWSEGRIGFHEREVNGWLRKHGPESLPPGRVLVPLCGKSLDLLWLVGRGFEVVGVELVGRPVEDLHRENGIDAAVTTEGPFRVWRSPGLTVFQGDWFALDPEATGACDAVWDRAAMIALSEEERGAYADRLLRWLRPGGRALLVTLDYEQERMDGPPYAVPEAEVRARYGAICEIEKLDSRGALDANPRFGESGLDRVVEEVFRLHRR